MKKLKAPNWSTYAKRITKQAGSQLKAIELVHNWTGYKISPTHFGRIYRGAVKTDIGWLMGQALIKTAEGVKDGSCK